MKGELLLLRLEVLKRGIKDVQEVLEAGKAAPAAIKKAQENVDSAWWFVNNILTVAENERVIAALKALPNNTGSEWKNELIQIADGLEQVRKRGCDLKRELEGAKEGLVEINSRTIHFSNDFGNSVEKRTKKLGQQIDDLVMNVEAQSSAAKLWQKYFDDIQPGATRLFVEYLDLLGGVSIRECGLALKALADVCHLDELCALADWHFTNELTLCQDSVGDAFVALPGRDLVTDISAWPILRLGFASWSIWGLPLEGHEFGKLLADDRMSDRSERRKTYWKPYITKFGERGTRVLIADSIAAWAEGPAYACALLFLVLNPSRVQSGYSARNIYDADRATVVLATLRDRATSGTESSQRSAGGYNYLPFIDALEKEWKDSCCFDDAALPAERVRLLQDLPGVVQLRLELQKAFDLKDWNLADRVLASLNNDQEVPVELAAGVRHLTNAAWRGRFTATDGTGRDEAGNAQLSPEELEQRAIKEGIALIKPRDKQLSGTNTNSLKTSGR
jgi:hypothetical protein